MITQPAAFAGRLNQELVKVVKSEGSFATATCGIVDLENQVFRYAGAGGPEVLLMHADGTHECLENPGFPLAITEDAVYQEIGAELHRGDSILLFSDGAVEVMNAAGKQLGVDGLIAILRQQGYPAAEIRLDPLEEELLKYSNAIRLEDDLTLIEIRSCRS